MRNSTLFLTLAVAVSALGQTTTQSNTDGVMPPAIAPGNPASSYALTGIDHVNMYNGNLNVTIPLYTVGGRGTAGYTIALPIERRWDVQLVTQDNNYYSASPVFWWGTQPDYSPGKLILRRASGNPNACYNADSNTWSDLGPFVTRAVWLAQDGTEITLLDGTYNGEGQYPLPGYGPPPCYLFDPSKLVDRGRVFKTTDAGVRHKCGCSGGSCAVSPVVLESSAEAATT